MGCPINLFSSEEVFSFFISTLKTNIKTWNYFVNWRKVLEKLKKLEPELHLLDFLVGKEKPAESLKELLRKYPSVAQTLPFLVALREKREHILVDILNFKYLEFDFSKENYSDEEIENLALFFQRAGLEDLFKKNIKSVCDYVLGVEVGLDSNGRKNRTGSLMEEICKAFIERDSKEIGFSFLEQATRDLIFSQWKREVELDRTDRRIDFAIFFEEKLFFVEVNFYAGGGSKLKATAGEYRKLASFWKSQGIEFVWITDGKGWLTAKNALREYLDDGNFLLNLEMLRAGCLKELLFNEQLGGKSEL
jgi:type II restriction enzyme